MQNEQKVPMNYGVQKMKLLMHRQVCACDAKIWTQAECKNPDQGDIF